MYKPTRTVETGEIIHIPLCSGSFVLKRYKVYQAWNFLFRICHQIAPHVSYSEVLLVGASRHVVICMWQTERKL